MPTPGPTSSAKTDGSAAVEIAAAIADIVVVVDGQGIVRDLKASPGVAIARDAEAWRGKRWIETVAPDSRNKAASLLSDAGNGRTAAPREINHSSGDPLATIPIRYCAVRGAKEGDIVIAGRDLSALAEVQQQLVQAHQAMERDYARQRASETRYRALFQLTGEPILIAELASRKVTEANPAAVRALATSSGRLAGRLLASLFEPAGAADLDGLMSRAAVGNGAVEARVVAVTSGQSFDATASLIRSGGSTLVLVRLAPTEGRTVDADDTSRVMGLIEKLPDGFVVTDLSGLILEANAAFLDLAQAASAEQVRGKPLGDWLGRMGIDFPSLTASLREYGSVRNFPTILRGAFGITETVEVSAVLVEDGELPCYGFVLRAGPRAAAPNGHAAAAIPRSVDQFIELVGRVSLKELVRETTDIIERLCIEAALEMTKDNRATAAELLGLSRQSLYLKMRRFGFMDEMPEAD
ncbi:transcriptional regulator PpsR [Phreatobacter sp.]|uniref:transcriptional regulator PpsR n=1 Tax=Phreatobacter sp. TaxID=1966341 RepID=UPI0022C4CC46|nr:transcriptional regulator PpsR [Phreatobacter sp.]MCZ8315476.1 transcriptional regulator PpsR [Phreatobacter sp.]